MRTWVFLIFTIGTPLLYGSETAGSLSPTVLFVASLVNLAILLFVLVKFGRPMVASFFAEREARIRNAFETYRREYERMEAELAQLREAIANLPAEKERTLATYRRRAEEIYAARMAEARAQAAYLRRTAEMLMQEEREQRRQQLIAALAERLVEDLSARARLFTPSDHRAIVESCRSLFERNLS